MKIYIGIDYAGPWSQGGRPGSASRLVHGKKL
jgi:hypothetical protein